MATPTAEAQRRAQRSGWPSWAWWIAAYVPGVITGKVLKHAFGLPHRMPGSWFWLGLGAILVICLIAHVAYYRLSGGRAAPEAVSSAFVVLLVGLWNGLS